MKKVINGKLYNTESAHCVGMNQYSYPGDFNYWCEELYKKKTGEYFLYGEGGAASRYRERVDANSYSSGSTIIPLDEEEAMRWAEEYLDSDKYIAEFGEPEE